MELDTYKNAAYELNKIFVETVGTIKKCDIDAINEAVDLFFDQDEPTDLIQIFVANTIQILNQSDLLVDVLGLSVLINEIIINHQLDDFNPNLWKMNHHRFFSIDYRDYLEKMKIKRLTINVSILFIGLSSIERRKKKLK